MVLFEQFSAWISVKGVFTQSDSVPLMCFFLYRHLRLIISKKKKKKGLDELLVPVAIISKREKVLEMFFFLSSTTAQIADMNGNYSCTD